MTPVQVESPAKSGAAVVFFRACLGCRHRLVEPRQEARNDAIPASMVESYNYAAGTELTFQICQYPEDHGNGAIIELLDSDRLRA